MRWADHVITRARLDAAGIRFSSLEVSDDGEGGLSNQRNESRAWVFEALRAGKTFVTAPPDPKHAERVREGDPVARIVVDGEAYLRVDGAAIPSDDLGLPDY